MFVERLWEYLVFGGGKKVNGLLVVVLYQIIVWLNDRGAPSLTCLACHITSP